MEGKFRIQITKEDIEVAEPNNVRRCVIVRAINRAYPELTHVSVSLPTIRFSNPEEQVRYIFKTPEKARQIIDANDNGGELRPRTFSLNFSTAQTKPTKVRQGRRNVGPTKVAIPRTAKENRHLRGWAE